ncbi:hypothetical protein Tco_1061373 [Tanacetum coccineum]
MYTSGWDKLSLESYKEKCEKLEKENEKYIITFSSLYDNDRQYTKKIQEQEESLDTMSAKLVELNNIVLGLQANISEKQTTTLELEECLCKMNYEKEHLKSKVVDCTMCQKLQVQVQELKSVNESLNLSVEELYKERALAQATLRERDKLITAQCEKMRLLEEQSEPFYEVQYEFDSEIVHDTQDNSEKEVILSLQTQLKETAELVVSFSDEKYCALKETESLKVEIKNFRSRDETANHFFEEDKRMFLAKNEFLEKVSSSVQKEYNDLLASNDVLKQSLETKFKFLKHSTSLERMIEMIEIEYESNISIISSTFKTKNLELVKEMGDKVKCFDEEKKMFETKISKLEMS